MPRLAHQHAAQRGLWHQRPPPLLAARAIGRTALLDIDELVASVLLGDRIVDPYLAALAQRSAVATVQLGWDAIAASNRINQKGAQVEVLLPKILS